MTALMKPGKVAAVVVILIAATTYALAQRQWVGSWAASQLELGPSDAPGAGEGADITLRQIVHLSLGGSRLRVRLSNRFGTAPLRFTSVHVARPVSSSVADIVAGSDRALSFSGKPGVLIPAGADYASDPVEFVASPLSDLAITLHLEKLPARQTGHAGSRATSYVVQGDRVAAASLPDAKTVEHWYFISGVDVAAVSGASAIVALGDSITDGHGTTTNGNDRWPDLLAKRLSAEKKEIAVLNQGIGGNRLLLDGIGPNSMARFDRDVLAQPGVRYLIVLEGVNDLGMLSRSGETLQTEHDAFVRRVTAAYQQMVSRAHGRGIYAIGATILPFTGADFYHPDAVIEADRQEVNRWIRTPGNFDAVLDFDKVMRDPKYPDQLLPAFDSGDHLHPSLAGYAAMAEAVPLDLFDSSQVTSDSALKLALTFDDLPAHGPLPKGTTRLEIAAKVLAALREAGVPPTYGFANGQPIEKLPADLSVLEAWRAAGQPLGNHTWSHMDLNHHSLEDFEADVNRIEPLLSQQMKDEDWRWFRFPFLSEGDTPAKTARIRTYLAQHGYRIAEVTMSFDDYEWNEPYARCAAKNDSKAIAALEATYLSAAEDSITYFRGLSHELYGRDIPYVLLLHVGALDAEMLPRLLKLYRSQGFSFVSLVEAEGDEFYRGSVNPALDRSPDTLEQVMTERNLLLPARASFAPLLDAVCR